MSDDTPSDLVISAHSLGKTFKDFWGRTKVQALTSIDFEVRRGEVFGLLGPNGAGKSTAIKLILGLLKPTSGDIEIFGQSPHDVRTKGRIGYLPEETYLYRYLTATEILTFYARLFEIPAQERRSRISELLKMIGLDHAEKRVVGEFSKGMARRIGLAQALVNDPELLILDEPTSGLDPSGRRRVKDLILTLARRGRTVILSSHLLADVEDICDRITILFNGRVLATGSTRELLETRQRLRLTFPEVDSHALDGILRRIQDESGEDAEVDRPTQSLERFFLDVIESARETETEQTGASPHGTIAPFLDRGANAHDRDA